MRIHSFWNTIARLDFKLQDLIFAVLPKSDREMETPAIQRAVFCAVRLTFHGTFLLDGVHEEGRRPDFGENVQSSPGSSLEMIAEYQVRDFSIMVECGLLGEASSYT